MGETRCLHLSKRRHRCSDAFEVDRPVHQQQVDMIGTEPFETRLDGGNERAGFVMVVVDLGRDEDVVTVDASIAVPISASLPYICAVSM